MHLQHLRRRWALALVALALAVGGAGSAGAQDTAAGTPIDNRASVTYSVGGVPQTLIESAPGGNTNPGATNGTDTTFLVDARIDLDVTWQDGTNVVVAPGQTNSVTTWQVENQGNGPNDFVLTAANNPNGTPSPDVGVDNFQATFPAATFWIETNATPGLQTGGGTPDTQQNFIDDLGAGGTQIVYLLANIPAAQGNGDISVVTLRATAHEATGAPGAVAAEDLDGADPDGIDEVFGDPAEDGFEEALGAYVVQAAALTITKTSVVLSDPINGVGPTAIAIPGAVVEYTVTIANAGPATATNVTVSDSLATEIAAGTIAFDVNGYGAGLGMQVTAPNINAGAPTALTNVGGDDQGEWNVTTPDTVIVNGIDLTTGQNGTVNFRVIIQ